MSYINQSTTNSLGFGVGLRSCHFRWLEQNLTPDQSGVDFFEAITENFLDHQGYARHILFKLREHYPIVLHGVSLSIGSTDSLNLKYLNKLKLLANELEPEWISDHLCWTGMLGINSHDLLPMPLTSESLRHVCQRVEQVQEIIERPLVLENPSSYLEFQQNDYTEWDFISELVKQTGCQLLVDVNNIYVSSFNLGFDPKSYLLGLPLDAVIQCHLAGPSHLGSHMIDTHDQPVPTPVLALYKDFINACQRPISTLLEWDANIPEFPQLVEELNVAKACLKGPIPHREFDNKMTDSYSTAIASHLDRTLEVER
ncbi:DUF692 domain-containing protein [Marinomonas fungiae]|uniref:MNIO family bufferin maturase n=1 Tax=Marinomonas fungiae TaxID=1137284 RepID=UPI003A949B45